MTDQDLKNATPDLRIIWNALVRRDTLPAYADAIVIGGCRDLGLAERAAELYHASVSKTIITTGYQPSHMDITEAKLLADHCVSLGVPADNIILENYASNTGENIRLSAQIISDAKSIILIHKPYMSLRFLATAEAQWPNPKTQLYATCQDITFEEYCDIRGLEKVAYAMLGDMKRMSAYAEAGYQSHQPISSEAHAAYEKLVSIGHQAR